MPQRFQVESCQKCHHNKREEDQCVLERKDDTCNPTIFLPYSCGSLFGVPISLPFKMVNI